MKIKYTKLQAFGNAYIFVDAINQRIKNPWELSKKMSDRYFGIGSDGMVLVCASESCGFRMRIFNPDGTEAEMCGNALRGTAKFLYYYGFTSQTHFEIETLGGNKRVQLLIEDGEVQTIVADIGKPNFQAADVPIVTDGTCFFHQSFPVLDKVFYASALSWGNPHTVIEVDGVDGLDVEKYGSAIEHMPCFPKRTNVTFAEPIDREHIKIREWERGTGETLGCGTGCCSAVAVFFALGKCGRNVEVSQPGGVLRVEYQEDGCVKMLGPSTIVCEGEFWDDTI